MQLAIIISGSIAAILFIISGVSYFFDVLNFRLLAAGFIAFSVLMFVLIIIRNIKQQWSIGGFKREE